MKYNYKLSKNYQNADPIYQRTIDNFYVNFGLAPVDNEEVGYIIDAFKSIYSKALFDEFQENQLNKR